MGLVKSNTGTKRNLNKASKLNFIKETYNSFVNTDICELKASCSLYQYCGHTAPGYYVRIFERSEVNIFKFTMLTRIYSSPVLYIFVQNERRFDSKNSCFFKS